MNIEHINQIGQVVLIWAGVLGTLWGLLKARGIVRVSATNKTAVAAEHVLWLLQRVADEAVQATEQEWLKETLPFNPAGTPDKKTLAKQKLAIAVGRVAAQLPATIQPDVEQLTTAVKAAVRRMNQERDKGQCAPKT